MQHVGELIPGSDFTLTTHFLTDIESGDRPASPFMHAAEFHHYKSWGLKSYFFARNSKPLHAGDSTTMEEWSQSIEKLSATNASYDLLKDFITNTSEGQVMVPV